MAQCTFFIENRESAAFQALKSVCPSCPGSGKRLYTECPHILECAGISGKEFKSYKEANTILNAYGEDRFEVVYYRESFKVPEIVINAEIDNSANFLQMGEYLVPQKPNADLDKYLQTQDSSRREAIEKYYGLALCNKWTHFFTFTISPELVSNKYSDIEAKLCWKLTREALQRFDPNVRILCVPEYHQKGGLHFHALVGFERKLYFKEFEIKQWMPIFEKKDKSGKVIKQGFCSFDKSGKLAYIPKKKDKYFLMSYYQYGERMKTKLGDPLYCTNFYKYGINSCAILPDQDNIKAVNYLVKYTSKDDVGYRQKRYYATRNLEYKGKEVMYTDETKIFDEFVEKKKLSVYKSNDKVIIFRNFNNNHD